MGAIAGRRWRADDTAFDAHEQSGHDGGLGARRRRFVRQRAARSWQLGSREPGSIAARSRARGRCRFARSRSDDAGSCRSFRRVHQRCGHSRSRRTRHERGRCELRVWLSRRGSVHCHVSRRQSRALECVRDLLRRGVAVHDRPLLLGMHRWQHAGLRNVSSGAGLRRGVQHVFRSDVRTRA